ncbi:trypsin-like peptidase domain-containing protein [Candidatus Woesearchaeota archaeon]|nr:trypsin-like peptidase domain-containing protein [Candidatus Woesearchaeota archaeon]
MVKKSLSILAAAFLAAAVGAPQVGCVSTYARTVNAIEARDARVRDDLGSIVDSVHCVRTVAEYRLDGAPEGAPTETRTGHGTALAYAYRGGYTYLVTNVHVVDDPERITEVELVPGPGGLAIVLNTYTKVSERTTLVADAGDTDDSDDILVEEVAKDAELDIAVVRTPQRLTISDSYVADRSITPCLGEEVYVVGYPRGRFSAVTRGVISHPDYFDPEDNEHLDVIDITSTFGNSGSPYFVRRGDQLYWAGVMGQIMTYRGTPVTLFTLGTPIRAFAGLLDRTEPAVGTPAVEGADAEED